jgi:hypothetical protein
VTLRRIVVVPATPLLVPEIAVARSGLDELQEAARQAVRGLLGDEPAEVVAVGAAPTTGELSGTWSWQPFGVARRGRTGPALPRPLGLAAWLLDDAGFAGHRCYLGVADDTTPAQCGALGRRVRTTADALLVVADGSARRSVKAPGHLDPRAEPFDAGVAQALRDGDVKALRTLDADLAGDLLVEGRTALHVLAAAGGEDVWVTDLGYDDAPLGVGWWVATWRRP